MSSTQRTLIYNQGRMPKYFSIFADHIAKEFVAYVITAEVDKRVRKCCGPVRSYGLETEF